MILLDVNVLVDGFRQDAPRHATVRPWLDQTIRSESAFAGADLVLSGFLRVVTHPKVFDPPTPLPAALEFVDALKAQPNYVTIAPGNRHWGIFRRLCIESGVRGNLIPDAYLAALAIESGSEWISSDRDFSRFEGLRWRPPA